MRIRSITPLARALVVKHGHVEAMVRCRMRVTRHASIAAVGIVALAAHARLALFWHRVGMAVLRIGRAELWA